MAFHRGGRPNTSPEGHDPASFGSYAERDGPWRTRFRAPPPRPEPAAAATDHRLRRHRRGRMHGGALGRGRHHRPGSRHAAGQPAGSGRPHRRAEPAATGRAPSSNRASSSPRRRRRPAPAAARSLSPAGADRRGRLAPLACSAAVSGGPVLRRARGRDAFAVPPLALAGMLTPAPRRPASAQASSSRPRRLRRPSPDVPTGGASAQALPSLNRGPGYSVSNSPRSEASMLPPLRIATVRDVGCASSIAA